MLQTIVRAPRLSEDLELGITLSRMQGGPIAADEVARVLNEAGIRYVLVGAHAANGYTGRPRGTQDVDVIVESPKKASAAVASAFPQLTMEDTPVVVRFKRGNDEAIDLMKPLGSPLWSRLLKESKEITIGSVPVRIPSLEGMLAAKFCSMVSPLRRIGDKTQDAADFLRMVEVNAQIDLAKLSELGELVYAGGGQEILQHVSNARAGKPLVL
jgi:hypothetical protein